VDCLFPIQSTLRFRSEFTDSCPLQVQNNQLLDPVSHPHGVFRCRGPSQGIFFKLQATSRPLQPSALIQLSIQVRHVVLQTLFFLSPPQPSNCAFFYKTSQLPGSTPSFLPLFLLSPRTISHLRRSIPAETKFPGTRLRRYRPPEKTDLTWRTSVSSHVIARYVFSFLLFVFMASFPALIRVFVDTSFFLAW
jgi:hypothetical protein